MLTAAALILPIAASPLFADIYKKTVAHKGRDVTPKEAYKLLQQDPKHTFLVDTRTQYEYQDVGHPEGAYNIPYEVYTDELKKTGEGVYEYKRKQNTNYCADLKELFNPATDTLVIICRSGGRSIKAVNSAVECGFSPEKTYNVMGGFEGDVVDDPTSPFFGKRMVGGWRLEGLPWTYEMSQRLIYQRDLKGLTGK
jgi:rhodanese-related sulfurtransferase